MPITLGDLKTAKDVTAIVKQAVEVVVALMKQFGVGARKDGARQKSAHGDYRPKKGDQVNTVLLVGMEGTGKTQLIHSCFGHEDANSARETEQFEIYTSQKQQDGKTHWINIADYMGENLGMLVSSFIDQQRLPHSPLKYGNIHSLILMVDLRPPEEDRSINAPSAPAGDLERMKEHLEQWNETAIDALFGILTEPALRYICVFINKYDLVSEPKKFSKARVKKYFAGLPEYLEQKVKPIKAGGKIRVDVIVGSAKYGDGHSELLSKLSLYSDTH